MDYKRDIRKLRESRGISLMKFCELSGVKPSVVRDIELSFFDGKTHGDFDIIDKIDSAMRFIERKDIRIRNGGDVFEVKWRRENGTEATKTIPFGTSLTRRIFDE